MREDFSNYGYFYKEIEELYELDPNVIVASWIDDLGYSQKEY